MLRPYIPEGRVMSVGAEQRGAEGFRLRIPRVSPTAFRAMCALALAAILIVTISGATVRLTGSGLGCENWPRCGEGFFPPKSFNSIVEFGNRAVGVAVGIVTVLAALAAFRVERLPRRLFWGAILLPVSVLAQGILGGITVLTDLHPLIVMGHFLLSIAAIALGVVVALGAHWFAVGRPERTAPRWLAWLACALLPLLVALVVTGAFVTAAGPHSGGENIERFGDLKDAAYLHVRVTAAFGIAFLVCLVAIWRVRPSLATEFALSGAILGLLVGQMVVGEVQWRNHLTQWWVILIHVVLASVVFAAMTLLAARLVARTGRA
jgi:cytochrome c oxidase assembly protein subunit 15